jgi:hypothetical protein
MNSKVFISRKREQESGFDVKAGSSSGSALHNPREGQRFKSCPRYQFLLDEFEGLHQQEKGTGKWF